MKKLYIFLTLSMLFTQSQCMERDDSAAAAAAAPASSATVAAQPSTVPTLFDLSASATAKYLSTPDGIQQFLDDPEYVKDFQKHMPPHISHAIAQKMMKQHGIPSSIAQRPFP